MHDAVRAEARWRGSEPTAPACAGHRLSRIACVGILTLLTACGKENRFIAPPPPKVTVELPVQRLRDRQTPLRQVGEQPVTDGSVGPLNRLGNARGS